MPSVFLDHDAPALKISPRADALEVCLELVGELDVATAGRLVEAVQSVCADRPGGDVQLGLSLLSFVDAAGLGAMVTARKRVRAAGGRFRVTGASPVAQRLMRATGLVEVLVSAGPVRPSTELATADVPAEQA